MYSIKMRKYAKISNGMEIKRDLYLRQLIDSKGNGMIKIVTGVRRCGKSYLLFKLFYDYLTSQGVDDAHIVRVDLEDRRNIGLRNPDTLLAYIDGKIADDGMYYILIDEVQLVDDFVDVLNSYLKVQNADLYVTGSNSRFLSKDVVTEFRGRGDEIRVRPLSFSEFMTVYGSNDRELALQEYMTYGGLPQIISLTSSQKKEEYLKNLFESTYVKDIKERYNIVHDSDLVELIDTLASSVGSLTNPSKLSNTFKSLKHSSISVDTIKRYIDFLQEAFLIEKAVRYDIKGRRYINSPFKYYFEDLGLRNAKLNFRQLDEGHLMENMIYNELRLRGLSVDVGQVPYNFKDTDGNSRRTNLEVDFVCNSGFRRYYIQSAVAMSTQEKFLQEQKSLLNIKDGFRKIIITGGFSPVYQNDNGFIIMNIYDFLTNLNSLNI